LTSPAYYQDKAIVLRYHYLNDAESRFTISPDRFRTQLDALLSHGYNLIGMAEYLCFVDTGQISPNAVLLTFDDGHEDFYLYGYPELKKRGIPATQFLIVKEIDEPCGTIRYLNWAQIHEMSGYGMTFYNHTYDNHRRFEGRSVMLGPIYSEALQRMETHDEYRERIKTDLQLAEHRLFEELGEQPKLFCFPYGEYNQSIVEAGIEIGIQLFFTIDESINHRRQSLIYRLNAGEPDISAQKLIEKIRFYHD